MTSTPVPTEPPAPQPETVFFAVRWSIETRERNIFGAVWTTAGAGPNAYRTRDAARADATTIDADRYEVRILRKTTLQEVIP